jgi:prepilin-type N-terminal cleavage/methylation domain-containing protein
MPNRQGLSLIELSLVVVIIGLLAMISIPNYIRMQTRAKEANVTAIAHSVQLAAEDHAASHSGIYSDLAVDLIPRLPGAMLQVNPFTGARSEPQFGVPAVTPGQIGIVVVTRGGANIGCRITGCGMGGLVVVTFGGL